MFLSKWIANWAAQREQNKRFDTFRRLLHHHINEYLYSEDITLLTSLDQHIKDGIAQNLGQMIDEIYAAENPFLEERKTIASLVFQLAAYQVLAMTEEDKSKMEDFAGVPWLSGQLHHHLPALTKHFEELEKDRVEYEIPDEALVLFCNKKAAALIFYLNALNLFRVVYEDHGAKKDWYRPFLVAMMIWRESVFRSKANLDDLGLDWAAGIAYSRFYKFVEMGSDNPVYEFDRSWKGFMKDLNQPGTPHYLLM